MKEIEDTAYVFGYIHGSKGKHAIPGKSHMKPQLFILSRDLLDSVSDEEVAATFEDMMELGIAQSPFRELSIQVPMDRVFRLVDKDGIVQPLPDTHKEHPVVYHIVVHEMAMQGNHLNILADIIVELVQWNDMKHVPDTMVMLRKMEKQGVLTRDQVNHFRDTIPEAAKRLLILLIVLLATRNVEKTVVRNKLAKFGVGKRKAEYTTTLKIGKVTERSEPTQGDNHEPGAPRRPHLRRGHIRRQRYGPNFELVKKVFIQPVFVNADLGFINARSAYNVSRAKTVLADTQLTNQ